MTFTVRYERMMLSLGYDPGIQAGSMTPYDIGRIIVACIEEERDEVLAASRAAVNSRLEEERRREEVRRASLENDTRHMSDLYVSPFRWPGGGSGTPR